MVEEGLSRPDSPPVAGAGGRLYDSVAWPLGGPTRPACPGSHMSTRTEIRDWPGMVRSFSTTIAARPGRMGTGGGGQGTTATGWSIHPGRPSERCAFVTGIMAFVVHDEHPAMRDVGTIETLC